MDHIPNLGAANHRDGHRFVTFLDKASKTRGRCDRINPDIPVALAQCLDSMIELVVWVLAHVLLPRTDSKDRKLPQPRLLHGAIDRRVAFTRLVHRHRYP
ncbi:Uncharacterised protein [Mycobacteroides abscessus subsp. abscessus]|nr:Uncharacterised protein [Mycobacteroides abscessus subsp. abscessus]